MGNWYTRPVLFVADIERASDFYVGTLGFTEGWRHVEDGVVLVAQVDRAGCEILLSSQWPAKVGGAMLFISLDAAGFTGLRADLMAKGAAVRDGWWATGR